MEFRAMITDGASRTYLMSVAILASALLITSCVRVSKGDVYQAVKKDIQIGAGMAEVKKHLESLEVNGVKAAVSDYEPNTSRYDIVAPNGKGVIPEGSMDASFSNGAVGRIFGCGGVFVIFHFDASGRLITYHIDCWW